MMEEINATKESLQLHLGRRVRHGTDGLDLGRQGGHPTGVNHVAKIRDLVCSQDTLLAVDAKSSARETLQNFPKILNMLAEVLAGDQDIVQIHKNAIKAPENTIHQSLERLGRIL